MDRVDKPVSQFRIGVARAVRALVALAVLCLASPALADSEKRTLPDYDGRGGQATTAGDVALWIPRILLSPLYLTSEYLLRRPLGALISGAERAGLPGLLYDFFTFGPDHKIGIVPIGFIDFGFQPSLGAYAFWDDALAHGNDLRLHATTWGADWIAGALADRIHLSSNPYDVAVLELSGVRRPDYMFFGLGPSSYQGDLMRFGADKLEARVGFDKRLWRSSSFHVRVGIRSVDFRRGGFNADPLLADALAGRTAPVPPGWARGYTTMVDSLDAAVDTRRPEAAGGSGVRVEADASYQGDLRQVGSWLNYGGAAGGFLDLNDHGRVISLSVSSHFADPVGHASIPFTELVQLGGFSPMRAFYQGRLADRSAAVAELAYHWPIWVWLDGAMRFEVGNVFGAHLHDFAPGLLRFSGSVGIESRQSSDNSLQLLFGLGSETFASGARLDAVRLVVGTTHGF